ncbi:uroporphyrinogen decarboxylase [Amylibacter kogurei]|uniref:Uroporphyrinogen decarboxylase n=1 Tax=Paramylibacter kogurei TaxID=1889778 RepID=A0A2G5K9E4_9RHOB|nr:uroporphyrinogen decarboxylase [Amylibacter kogurei]PIB26055.1 uroporphyrinogen decarboxylase [Amylibacter kogurei]
MKTDEKLLMRALAGETLTTPPVWMMRQAGRYLPEYKATRAEAGDFLSLCYNSDLATEVTLQPIRRYGFDAAILFADILLVPQALGADLWFETGEGPRLSTIQSKADFNKLGNAEDVHETLSPIYQTIRNLREALPKETALIGFAGAPWTVATYMIAGRGTPDQAPALALMKDQPAVFDALMDKITDATIEYLIQQIKAGAEVIKLFDSWAGALTGFQFPKYITRPAARIASVLREEQPHVRLIGFPRGATADGYVNFARETEMDCVAIDGSIDAQWAADNLQTETCVQGNLDQRLLVSGGDKLVSETKRIVETLSQGPHIFNLGHGITPDADPKNVEIMIKAIRG